MKIHNIIKNSSANIYSYSYNGFEVIIQLHDKYLYITWENNYDMARDDTTARLIDGYRYNEKTHTLYIENEIINTIHKFIN